MGQYLVTIVRKPTARKREEGALEEVLLEPTWLQASSAENAKVVALGKAQVVGEVRPRVEALVIQDVNGKEGRNNFSGVSIQI